ncbi:head maturation protease, ClpP-related [Limibacter armeniacum]|uniref:head maturation protease, ClpP-related n=1 Tax=Limibacter armeniacum TaxID=466084 RepID=UPI002FE5B131
MFEIVAKSSQREADIMLHGDIMKWGEVDLNTVKAAVAPLLGKYSTINLRIHSPGGSVFEGSAIYSYLKSLPVKVNAYVDGISASMMTIVMLAAGRVEAARNARFLVHGAAVSPAGRGTPAQYRKAAEEIESMNRQMAEIYAGKTGKEASWVLENWLGENEVHLSAQEALEAGLIDGIYESRLMMPPEGMEADRMVAFYDKQILGKPKSKMKQQLMALLAMHGMSLDPQASASDEAFMGAFTARFNALVQAKEKLEAQMRASEGEQLLGEAVAQRKLTAKQAENLKPMLETSGIEAIRNYLACLEPVAVVSQQLQREKQTPTSPKAQAGRDNWTFDDYQKKDPKALLHIKEQEPEKYSELVQAYINQ